MRSGMKPHPIGEVLYTAVEAAPGDSPVDGLVIKG
jgi:hypothetical protein